MDNNNSDSFSVVVRSIINNQRNKILIIKADNWELPGGPARHLESPRDALIRTAFETTGLVIDPLSDTYYCFIKKSPQVYLASDALLVTDNIALDQRYADHVWADLDNIFTYDLDDSSHQLLVDYYKDIEKLNKLEEPAIRPVILVARGLIRNEKNKILFLKRAPHASFSNVWELPGGKLNTLESVEDALAREIFEETGLVVEIRKPPIYIDSNIQSKGRLKGYTYVNLIFEAELIAGKYELTDKHSDYRWFTKSEAFRQKLASYMRPQLSRILYDKS